MARFIGKYVGQAEKRIDAYEKVTGTAEYSTDVATRLKSKAVQMRALTSPHAHAKITKLDLSKAEAAPGVVGIITGNDDYAWENFPKTSVLAQDNEVIWAGQIVALVAAETEEQAWNAIELIDVEYDTLN